MRAFVQGLPEAVPPALLSLEPGEFDSVVSKAMGRILRYRTPEAWGPRSLGKQLTADAELYGLPAKREDWTATVMRVAFTSCRMWEGRSIRRFAVHLEEWQGTKTYLVSSPYRWPSDDHAPAWLLRDEGGGARHCCCVPLQAPDQKCWAHPGFSRGREWKHGAGARAKSAPGRKKADSKQDRQDQEAEQDPEQGTHEQWGAPSEEPSANPVRTEHGWRWSSKLLAIQAKRPQRPPTLAAMGVDQSQLTDEERLARNEWNRFKNKERRQKNKEAKQVAREVGVLPTAQWQNRRRWNEPSAEAEGLHDSHKRPPQSQEEGKSEDESTAMGGALTPPAPAGRGCLRRRKSEPTWSQPDVDGLSEPVKELEDEKEGEGEQYSYYSDEDSESEAQSPSLSPSPSPSPSPEPNDGLYDFDKLDRAEERAKRAERRKARQAAKLPPVLEYDDL